MRRAWMVQCILGALLLHACRGQSGEDYGAELDPRDSLFPLPFNYSLVADDVVGSIVQNQEELSNVCSITLLTSEVDMASGHQTSQLTPEDLRPIKGLIDGTSSVLESLTMAVRQDIGKGSYQSLITKCLLDITQQNEASNNVMADIRGNLEAQHSADCLLTKFKEKVGKMEAMVHTIHHLASQVEQMSESLARELGKSGQMDFALGQELH
ncbi:uncharacterized protein [Narcine bancroftii]|uniref:uncharacterized protein n=1 Tax=Narcine bancroftii TaxID=1343680 RepID=UPI0038315B32